MSMEEGDKLAQSVQKEGHPRVTLGELESKVKSEQYFSPTFAPHVTMCALELENGYVLQGMSAPADPANFDATVGRKFAREDALRKLWPLEGYLLREKLHNA